MFNISFIKNILAVPTEGLKRIASIAAIIVPIYEFKFPKNVCLEVRSLGLYTLPVPIPDKEKKLT